MNKILNNMKKKLIENIKNFFTLKRSIFLFLGIIFIKCNLLDLSYYIFKYWWMKYPYFMKFFVLFSAFIYGIIYRKKIKKTVVYYFNRIKKIFYKHIWPYLKKWVLKILYFIWELARFAIYTFLYCATVIYVLLLPIGYSKHGFIFFEAWGDVFVVLFSHTIIPFYDVCSLIIDFALYWGEALLFEWSFEQLVIPTLDLHPRWSSYYLLFIDFRDDYMIPYVLGIKDMVIDCFFYCFYIYNFWLWKIIIDFIGGIWFIRFYFWFIQRDYVKVIDEIDPEIFLEAFVVFEYGTIENKQCDMVQILIHNKYTLRYFWSIILYGWLFFYFWDWYHEITVLDYGAAYNSNRYTYKVPLIQTYGFREEFMYWLEDFVWALLFVLAHIHWNHVLDNQESRPGYNAGRVRNPFFARYPHRNLHERYVNPLLWMMDPTVEDEDYVYGHYRWVTLLALLKLFRDFLQVTVQIIKRRRPLIQIFRNERPIGGFKIYFKLFYKFLRILQLSPLYRFFKSRKPWFLKYEKYLKKKNVKIKPKIKKLNKMLTYYKNKFKIKKKHKDTYDRSSFMQKAKKLSSQIRRIYKTNRVIKK